ncbi:retrovirus-related pol polyprotein from transposon TNT 1-94 [Tanacetum coccineum]
MELYMMNRQHGRMILESVENGPLIWLMIEENGVTRPRKYSKLSATDAIQADCDVKDGGFIRNFFLGSLYSMDHLISLNNTQTINHQPSTLVSITYPSNDYQSSVHHNVYSLQPSIPQLEYAPTINQQPQQPKFSQLKLGLTVPVFKQGDDPIDVIKQMMSFLSVVVISRYPTTNNQLRNLSNPRQQATINDGRVTLQPGHMSKQCTKPKRKQDDSWFKDKVFLVQAQVNGQILHEEELAFLADPRIIKVALMANLSHFGSDVLAEVYNPDNMDNNMINQDVQVRLSSEQSSVVNYSETEIPNDSNIIPYSHQVINCTKINQDNKSVNDTLSAELERYKEQVKVLKEGQKVDLKSKDNISDSCEQSVEIDHLKQTLFKHLKEKESLMQTVTFLKNDFKKEEFRNIDREIALEKKIKQLDNIVYKRDQSAQTAHIAIVIPDSEETLMLAEESRSKMLLKQQDPMVLEKKVNTTPVDYANSINSSDPSPSCKPTKVKVPKELPKVSVRNYEFLVPTVPTDSTKFLLVSKIVHEKVLSCSIVLLVNLELAGCVGYDLLSLLKKTWIAQLQLLTLSLEKQDLQAKLENERTINAKWKESSKNMDKLINSSMSSRSKFGLRFGETFGSDEVFDPSAPSIFDTTPEDVEGKPLYNRLESLESMPKPVIIEPKTSEYAFCKSNLSAKSHEFFPKFVCAMNESVRKADNLRKNNKSPREKLEVAVIDEVLQDLNPRYVYCTKELKMVSSPPWHLPFWVPLELTKAQERVNGYLYKVPTGSTQFLLVVKFSLPGLMESFQDRSRKGILTLSMVNISLKKLKHYLAGFDVVVKERTTAITIIEGSWGSEHTKACFRDEIIPFVKELKDIFNTFDQYLIDELTEVQNIFHQIEQVVEQHGLKAKMFEVKMNQVLNENKRLLEQVINKDIMNIVVNYSMDNASVNVHECEKYLKLETELLNKKDFIEKETYDKLLRSYTTLEKYCIALEVDTQLNQEFFHRDNSVSNQSAPNFDQYFELNELEAQSKLKGKYLADNVVTKHTIAPEMLKINVEPIASRLLNNRAAHSDYLRHTQEQAAILKEIVEQGKSQNPQNNSLNSACNTKKDKIQQTPSSTQKNKVEAHSRTVKSSLKNKNYVVEPKGTANVQHFKLNANFELLCVKCNGCMLSDNLDLCVLDFINDRPTGRTFTIVGNACPLTRITTTSEVPLKKPTALETDTPKPVVTLVYSRKPKKSKTNVPVNKPKIIKSISELTNFVNKFLGSVKFRNDHMAKILGYGDYQIGNVTILKVYYVEGLGHNLFFVGQLCDSNLEGAFRQHTCFIRNLEDVDLLTGSRGNNLYTLSLRDMMTSSPICLLSKASKTKFWLWHRRLSHLNFVLMERSTSSSLSMVTLDLHSLKYLFDESEQQNGVVKRRNRTLIEAARTMLIYAKASLFLWAEVVATACYTQNRSIIRLRHGKTSYELLHDKLPDLSFLYVFGDSVIRQMIARTRIIEAIHVDFDELTAMASELSSLEPALQEMIPATISSGLVPNLPPSTLVDRPAPKVIAPIAEVVASELAASTGSPSSTTVDQDAPSPNVAHINNDPFFGIPIPENNSEASSSFDVIPTIVQTAAPYLEHVNKWTKDHPLDNIIGELERPVSTRLQLHEQTLFCYYDAFLTSVEPKNYKDALTQACWIEAMQEELNEFEPLEV